MPGDSKFIKKLWIIGFYSIAIILGVINGLWGNAFSLEFADILSQIFIRLFKFIAVPIIGVSVIVTIASLGANSRNRIIWKRALFYTLTTTVAAATVAAVLYTFFSPEIVSLKAEENIADTIASKGTYIDNLISAVPDNILQPLLEGKVLAVLCIALAVGIAINRIQNQEVRNTISNFFAALQQILFTFVKWLINILPLGIFGFISACFVEFKSGVNLGGLGTYFVTIISANLVQMFIILPLFLLFKGLNPLLVAKGMFKALMVAFFSKSSAATLPVTMQCAEEKCQVRPLVSRFVLPICTTINMNGCAAFILITVIYLMQNAGIEISFTTLLAWVFIATVAAIGNAGVPMGCFFLSASLLSSMDVSILLMGIILPFYNVIDMLETSLNVWSDSCVANMVNKDVGNQLDVQKVDKV